MSGFTFQYRTRVFVLLAAALFSGMAHADVLLIEKVEQSNAMQLPANGITMAAVESRWGTPVARRNAVGDPPITRWQYADWSVYFEHDRVITSVLHTSAE